MSENFRRKYLILQMPLKKVLFTFQYTTIRAVGETKHKDNSLHTVAYNCWNALVKSDYKSCTYTGSLRSSLTTKAVHILVRSGQV